MTTAKQTQIDRFCRELAPILRRLSGRLVEFDPGALPLPAGEITPKAKNDPASEANDE